MRASNLDLINGRVLDLPNSLLKKIADQPRRPHRPLRPSDQGAQLPHRGDGRRARRPGHARLHRRRRRRRDHRLGHHLVARRPHEHDVEAVSRTGISASPSSWTSSTAARCRTTTTATAAHVAGIIAGNGRDSQRREGRHRAGRHPGLAEGARRAAARARSATSSRRSTGSSPTRTTYNIRVVNMSVGAGDHRVVLDRPADARDQGARSTRASSSSTAAGNIGKNAARQAAVRRHHRAGQRAVGADRRRLEHDGHADAQRRRDGGLQLARSDGHRLRREAGPGRAGHRHRLARRAGQHASTSTKADVAARRHARGLGSKPYLSLSGTSMAAPVVDRHRRADAAGQPEPDAEPDQGDPAVHRAGLSGLQPAAQGAGFLNTNGAVRLAQVLREPAAPATAMPIQTVWSRHIIWGNHTLQRGFIKPTANAWANGVVWGSAKTLGADGDNIVWGTDGRRRQHRLGHRRPTATTSSGAPRPTATTSSGAPPTRRRQHRVGHRLRRRRLRQHRLGHRATATTSSGARPPTATTSSGAPRPTATTSSGARPRTTTSTWGSDAGDDGATFSDDVGRAAAEPRPRVRRPGAARPGDAEPAGNLEPFRSEANHGKDALPTGTGRTRRALSTARRSCRVGRRQHDQHGLARQPADAGRHRRSRCGSCGRRTRRRCSRC